LPRSDRRVAIGQQATAFRNEGLVLVERGQPEHLTQRADRGAGPHHGQSDSRGVQDLHPHAAAGHDRRDHRAAGAKELVQIVDEAQVAHAVWMSRRRGAGLRGADDAQLRVGDALGDSRPQVQCAKECLLVRRPVPGAHQHQPRRRRRDVHLVCGRQGQPEPTSAGHATFAILLGLVGVERPDGVRSQRDAQFVTHQPPGLEPTQQATGGAPHQRLADVGVHDQLPFAEMLAAQE